MEFDEMKTIWDAQNNKPLYAIDENALHNRIVAKKHQARGITNVSELMLIIVNLISGFFVLFSNSTSHHTNIFMYLLAGWMLLTALAMLFSRIKRMNANAHFDRSLRGDLDHAISTATYQVRLSQLMRWNILPIGTLIVLGLLSGGNSIWFTGFVIVGFALTIYASKWEHGIYQSRKQELEMLRSKLCN